MNLKKIRKLADAGPVPATIVLELVQEVERLQKEVEDKEEQREYLRSQAERKLEKVEAGIRGMLEAVGLELKDP